MADNSSIPPDADKLVIVRVKRKAIQSPIDAFWLEINDRPLKRALHDLEKLSISNASSSTELGIQERPFQRPLLDLEKLSLSDASSSTVEELGKKKILVRHVKTIASSEETFDVLRSFVPNSSVELKSEEKNEGRRRSLKSVNRQDPSQVKVRQRQEIVSRNARFEQIWRSRKEMQEAPEDEVIYDMCKLYDVVRVDVEEENVVEAQNDKDTDLDDCKMMADFLPLLKDVLPNAAEEIESNIQDFLVKQASPDGYVYDVYAVNEDADDIESDPTSRFPLVQVDDNDDFFDGPDSEYESDDSNAENNPMNDYPEEEMSEDEDEDEDETTSRSSAEESEGESRTSGSNSEEEEGSEGSGSSVSLPCYSEEYDLMSDNGDWGGDESDDELYL